MVVVTPISQMGKVRPREGLGCAQVTQNQGHLTLASSLATPGIVPG